MNTDEAIDILEETLSDYEVRMHLGAAGADAWESIKAAIVASRNSDTSIVSGAIAERYAWMFGKGDQWVDDEREEIAKIIERH